MKERDSNIELFRCVVMFLIVAHHYLMHSDLLNITAQNLTSSYSVFLYLFGMWGKVGVNCFVVITGYYMCKSEITIKKFIKLLLEVEFYKIAILLFFIILGHHRVSFMQILISLLPITDIANNFVDCYLVFYLFIPYLNIFINSLTSYQHKGVIILCLFVFCIWPQLHLFNVQNNYVVWFSVIYLVSSYIRIYEIDKKRTCQFWGLTSLVFILLACLSVTMLLFAGKQWPFIFVYDCNSVFAVIISVTSFLFFKKIPLKNRRLINIIGASTFGILLIHDANWEMRHWLWIDIFKCKSWYGGMILVHSVFAVTLVFIICSIIDHLRARYFERPLLKCF